ncbi:MAG: shikimate dehydrogenase family protein [Acidimicrobiia bacterium]
MKRFGVVGDPVLHSLSPAIHNAAFRQVDIDAEYVHLPTKPAALPAIIAELRRGTLSGVSVTMPHKASAYASVDQRNVLAERSHAVNTIVPRGEALHGYNTDVAGVKHALSLLDLPPDTPVLVLGTGGAARAALVASADRDVAVSGRSRINAADVLSRTDVSGVVHPWGEPLPNVIVINATPLGMHGEELPPGLVGVASGLVDMTYGTATTPAIAASAAAEIPSSDGIDMLVGQAADAFVLFSGESAPLSVMEAAARG